MEHSEQRAPPRDPTVAELEARLGLPLPDTAIALAALTHKSFVNEHREEGLRDNERLEFLGDAVIALAVSHRLMERFPAAREGELSKIRAALVDEAGLAGVARELDLGPLLRLGRGEELTGGRQKSSLLADAMEAVVAALYLGGGLPPVLALIDRFLGEAFARAAAGTLDRDYKTQLQELAQSRLRVSPRYRVVAAHGPDHSKVFDVELELRGSVIGRGVGRSKKDAEQAAAKLALEAMAGRELEEVAPCELPAALAGAEPAAEAGIAPPARDGEDLLPGVTPEDRAASRAAVEPEPQPVPSTQAQASPPEAVPAPPPRAAPFEEAVSPDEATAPLEAGTAPRGEVALEQAEPPRERAPRGKRGARPRPPSRSRVSRAGKRPTAPARPPARKKARRPAKKR